MDEHLLDLQDDLSSDLCKLFALNDLLSYSEGENLSENTVHYTTLVVEEILTRVNERIRLLAGRVK